MQSIKGRLLVRFILHSDRTESGFWGQAYINFLFADLTIVDFFFFGACCLFVIQPQREKCLRTFGFIENTNYLCIEIRYLSFRRLSCVLLKLKSFKQNALQNNLFD